MADKGFALVGANGAIGSALVRQALKTGEYSECVRFSHRPLALPSLSVKSIDLTLDYIAQMSIEKQWLNVYQAWSHQADKPNPMKSIAQLWIATGFLHNKQIQPERRHEQMSAESLQFAYQMNAVAPMLFLSQWMRHWPRRTPLKIGILSARVGSISDNRLGGWHSYRASKAALNMLIKNLAIELRRSHPLVTLVGFQPGTTQSPLSAPFIGRVPEEQLQSPDFTAVHLLQAMANRSPADSGLLFDFLGQGFEP
ncbi:SDR family NAD(P)-dependent oxidoreductase [Thiomicrospira microaerophila]|uniref:SDR family NAD(P)-dependent oxidoreductase n=1 Tax=Thiomicrospira microaerophila TaxID=406020 RepID=UPI00200D41E0|nr:SDR family NAD(P)-dependent oxidoreductase [Thiomicrospira microaerophila]UQB41915.1 SDR family NAD(P)-dependent oxidoreductase [Thiomicrospira microaerophila]